MQYHEPQLLVLFSKAASLTSAEPNTLCFDSTEFCIHPQWLVKQLEHSPIKSCGCLPSPTHCCVPAPKSTPPMPARTPDRLPADLLHSLFPQTQSLRLLSSSATEHHLQTHFPTAHISYASLRPPPSDFPPSLVPAFQAPTLAGIPCHQPTRPVKQAAHSHHTLKIQRSRNQGTKQPPNKNKGRNQHIEL